MRKYVLAGAVSALTFVAVSARAGAEAVTTLDFSNIPAGSKLGSSAPGVSYTQNGYRFEFAGGQDVTFVDFGSSRVAQGNANTGSLGSGILVSRIDGLPFTLYSVDSANPATGRPTFPLFVDSSTGSRFSYPVTSQSLVTINTSADFANVTSATFSLLNLPNQGNNTIITNLVVSAVPEPAALSLLAPVGLLLSRSRR